MKTVKIKSSDRQRCKKRVRKMRRERERSDWLNLFEE